MNTQDGYDSDFESHDFLLNIPEILGKRYNSVKYVLHRNQRLTIEEYEVSLCSLRGYSYDKIIRGISDDRIVGEGWWYVFSSICCADPFWNLYVHPDYK